MLQIFYEPGERASSERRASRSFLHLAQRAASEFAIFGSLTSEPSHWPARLTPQSALGPLSSLSSLTRLAELAQLIANPAWSMECAFNFTNSVLTIGIW